MDETFTIKEFITAEKISIAFFYQLDKRGKAPRTYYVGDNRRITRTDWEKWRAERMAAAAPGARGRGRPVRSKAEQVQA
jgi:hypothetical protein